MKSLFLVLISCLILIDIHAQEDFPFSVDLIDMEGKVVNTKTFMNDGKPVLIDFWGSFCKPCIVKYNSMKDTYSKWVEETGVRIIIVSIDPDRLIPNSKKMIEKYEWPYEAYFDPERKFMGLLTDGSSVPRTFIFDRENEQVFSKVGASMEIKDPNSDEQMMDALISGSLEKLTVDLDSYEKALYKAIK